MSPKDMTASEEGENSEEDDDTDSSENNDDVNEDGKDGKKSGEDQKDYKKLFHASETKRRLEREATEKRLAALEAGKTQKADDDDVDLSQWDEKTIKVIKKVAGEIVGANKDPEWKMTSADEKELDAFIENYPDATDEDTLAKIMSIKKKLPELSFKKIYKVYIVDNEDAPKQKKVTSAGKSNGSVVKDKDKGDGGSAKNGGDTSKGGKKQYSEKELSESFTRVAGLGK